MIEPKRNSIVRDTEGNHYRVIDVVGDMANIESVATKELFTFPIRLLMSTDRTVM